MMNTHITTYEQLDEMAVKYSNAVDDITGMFD